MASIRNTSVVLSPITPPDSEDTFPTHYAKYGNGGYISVNTFADLLEVQSPRLALGMMARVNDTGKFYVYKEAGWDLEIFAEIPVQPGSIKIDTNTTWYVSNNGLSTNSGLTTIDPINPEKLLENLRGVELLEGGSLTVRILDNLNKLELEKLCTGCQFTIEGTPWVGVSTLPTVQIDGLSISENKEVEIKNLRIFGDISVSESCKLTVNTCQILGKVYVSENSKIAFNSFLVISNTSPDTFFADVSDNSSLDWQVSMLDCRGSGTPKNFSDSFVKLAKNSYLEINSQTAYSSGSSVSGSKFKIEDPSCFIKSSSNYLNSFPGSTTDLSNLDWLGEPSNKFVKRSEFLENLSVLPSVGKQYYWSSL